MKTEEKSGESNCGFDLFASSECFHFLNISLPKKTVDFVKFDLDVFMDKDRPKFLLIKWNLTNSVSCFYSA